MAHLSADTLLFLAELADNNSKEWFDTQKKRYTILRQEFTDFVEELIVSVGQIDRGVEMSFLKPKDCLMRINRDIRFSKDKSPYKTNFFAVIAQGGKKSQGARYYLNIEPGGLSFAGAGIYMPPPEHLESIRLGIVKYHQQWTALLEEPAFLSAFPKGVESHEYLKRLPKGFTEELPGSAYLKHKGFYTMQYFSDEEVLQLDFSHKVVKSFEVGSPLVSFLNSLL